LSGEKEEAKSVQAPIYDCFKEKGKRRKKHHPFIQRRGGKKG